jgi:hypothetical protein
VSTEELVPFVYREFSNRPRMLAFLCGGRCYALECRLDDVADEYSARYAVFELSFSALGDLPGSWVNLTEGSPCLGYVEVAEVAFDPTYRAMLRPSLLEQLSPM